MKRTPELRTLSEDHHHGLVHARRLRRATEADETDSAESVAKGFLEERVVFPHIEESSLSPEMVRKNPPPLDPLRPPQSCDDAHRRGP
jgi:hypothetical protein